MLKPVPFASDAFAQQAIMSGEGARAAALLIASAITALDRDPGAVRSYLGQLETLIFSDTVADLSSGPESTKGGLAGWQVRRIVRHIELSLAGTVSIEELADIARLSSSHFCRSFKISMDDTPHRFVMRKRIERAQELMLATDDPLSQIACDCGLTDQAHLTRLFRKFIGKTPLAWRRIWKPAA